MALSEIVDVQISRDTVAVTQVGFGTGCIVGDNPTFTERLRYYTDLSSLASDLTGGVADPEYAAAEAIFAQKPRSERVAVGRIDVGDADITASLNAINDEQPDWYGFCLADRTQADQLLAAAWAETAEPKKLFWYADDDTDIPGVVEGSATDLPKQLKDLGYDRSIGIYDTTADGSATDVFADSAFIGRILPFNPGSYTAKFKRLIGVVPVELSPTGVTNTKAKNCNMYREIAGVKMTMEGVVASGEFIDVIHFIDWLEARIAENVFGQLAREDKVPYTDGGIASIETRVKEILQVGQNRGGISPHAFNDDDERIGGFVTSVPRLEDITDADKIARTLNDVEFTAWLAGAIHKVVIRGVVTV